MNLLSFSLSIYTHIFQTGLTNIHENPKFVDKITETLRRSVAASSISHGPVVVENNWSNRPELCP